MKFHENQLNSMIFDDDHKLIFYGYGGMCEWQIEAEIESNQFIFTEKEVYDLVVSYSYSGQPNSMYPIVAVEHRSCKTNTEKYGFNFDDHVLITVNKEIGLGMKANEQYVVPAFVYYQLIKAKSNQEILGLR